VDQSPPLLLSGIRISPRSFLLTLHSEVATIQQSTLTTEHLNSTKCRSSACAASCRTSSSSRNARRLSRIEGHHQLMMRVCNKIRTTLHPFLANPVYNVRTRPLTPRCCSPYLQGSGWGCWLRKGWACLAKTHFKPTRTLHSSHITLGWFNTRIISIALAPLRNNSCNTAHTSRRAVQHSDITYQFALYQSRELTLHQGPGSSARNSNNVLTNNCFAAQCCCGCIGTSPQSNEAPHKVKTNQG
jgi:hypothetical protein